MGRLMGFGLLKPKQKIPGSDIAGRIEAVGRNVKQFRPGWVKNQSAFFPGKCILQLRIQDARLTHRNEIWRSITEDHDLEMAIGSTEDVTSLSIFLDQQKQTKMAALGFEHRRNLEEAQRRERP